MQNNYWIKDTTKHEIITKTQIPNKANFNLFANYYNLLDIMGLGFQLSIGFEITIEKLFRKSDFEYIILDLNGQEEFFILPNESIVEYTKRVALKIDVCKTEKDVVNLLIEEMN
jgi:hypothetical protein